MSQQPTKEEVQKQCKNLQFEVELLRSAYFQLEETRKKLAKQRALYRSIVKASPVGMGIVDADRNLLEVNERFCEMLGYKEKELVGKNARFLYPSKAAYERVGKEKYGQIEEKGVGSVETKMKKKNGEVIDVSLSSAYIEPGDRSQGVVFTVLDISLRKQKIEELEQSKRRYETLLENTGAATCIVEEDQTISYVNKGFCEVSGYEKEEVEGKLKWTKFVMKRYLPMMLKYHMMRRVDPDSAPSVYEFKFVDKKGEVHDVLANLAMIEGTKQSVASLVDITEQKQAEEKEKELDVLKSRFITALTHVTRTPLNEIRWNLESLLSGQFGNMNPEHEVFVRRALDSEADVLRLIGNMSTALDIERGHLTIETVGTDLESLAKSIVESFRPKAQSNNIVIKYKGPNKELNLMDLDSEKVRRVIEIMLDNAIRYTSDGGTVWLEVTEENKRVVMRVVDQGIGIPKTEQSNIFKRFFRASNAQIMNQDGVGLGLYIAQSFIKAHKGKIGFESEEGKGSTFWFSFPIK